MAEKQIVTQNKRAQHDYFILERYEAGISLVGSEVKSLRDHKANLSDSYCEFRGGEVFLVNAHISPYSKANISNHDPLRDRKLLLHKDEIIRLRSKAQERGLTVIPLSIYFKDGKAKVEIALAKGKKIYDKRQEIARKAAEREVERALKVRHFRGGERFRRK